MLTGKHFQSLSQEQGWFSTIFGGRAAVCHGVSAVGGRVREPRARRDGGSNVRERSDRPGV